MFSKRYTIFFKSKGN